MCYFYYTIVLSEHYNVFKYGVVFAGFFIIITYDCRTLNFASVRSHLLSAIPLKTVSQMQKHPCKLSDIPVQKGLHLSQVWPYTF